MSEKLIILELVLEVVVLIFNIFLTFNKYTPEEQWKCTSEGEIRLCE